MEVQIKTKFKILFLIITLIMVLSIPNLSNATTVTVDDIRDFEVTNIESGNCVTGDKVIFKLTANINALQDLPKLTIQFGDSEIRTILPDTIETITDYLTYTYTITSEDIGTLNVQDIIYEETTDIGVSTVKIDISELLTKTIIANQSSETIEWTDFSKATYEWSEYTDTDHTTPNLLIKNVDFKNSNTTHYYIYLSNDETDTVNVDSSSLNNYKMLLDGKISASDLKNVIESKGKIYLWIIENNYTESKTKIVVEAKEITRLTQLQLTKRIIGYYNSDSTNISCREVYSASRKVNYKIGRITDMELLKLIKNNTNDSLSNLLNYAKSQSAISTGTLSLGENLGVLNNVELVNEAYYFIYMELEDDDGIYNKVEDIALCQAKVEENGSKNLINYFSSEFKFVTEDNEIKDNTVAKEPLPYTGLNVITYVILATLIITSIYFMHQNKKYRDIK